MSEQVQSSPPPLESDRELASPAPHPSPDPAVIVIPRALFNYIVIGLTMLVVGLIVGVVAYDRFAASTRQMNAELINQAVGTAVAAMPQNAVPTPRPTADPNFRYDVDDGGNPFLGAADAPITMIEFGDFRCGFCKRFNDETLAPLLQQYEGQIRFVYRDYPILGPDSLQAALAAQCAHDQGQFWPFHDLLYSNPSNLTRTAFLTYAEQLALDIDTFTTCLDNAVHQEEINADYAVGQQLGVGGTPTFFINGRIITGAQPIEVFQRLLDDELAQIAAASGTS
ncbi:DsbA family protein [Anaerolineae bacterium CFX9]|nr:DsbA family protein [Anaerolineae bacterium CFX9]